MPWIKQRYWVFIWDLRLKSLWQVNYMPIFLLRRALVVLIAVTLFDYPGIQLQLFYMTQVFYMLYVWHFPHNLIQHNWQENFNEVCFFLLGYHIINFSANGPSEEMMLKIGESMVVITLI